MLNTFSVGEHVKNTFHLVKQNSCYIHFYRVRVTNINTLLFVEHDMYVLLTFPLVENDKCLSGLI